MVNVMLAKRGIEHKNKEKSLQREYVKKEMETECGK